MKNTILTLFSFLLVLINSTIAQEFKKINIDDFLNGTFYPNYLYELRWMKNGQYYTALEDNMIVKYQVMNGQAVDTLYDGNKFDLAIEEYSFSADEKQLLIATGIKRIYRRSYTAIYYVHNLKEELPRKLSEDPISYATFSPDGKMIAFVRDNDLYFTKLVNMTETRVTSDGVKNKVINGSTDWVYEEELYLTKAFFWSPDNRKIAFYRFDESKVKEYNMQVWNAPKLYPSDYRFKYPKAGEENSVVDIYVYDLEENTKQKMDLGKDADIYVPKITWTQDPNMLAVQRLNRLQNSLDIMHCDIEDGYSEVIFTDRSNKYIDINYCSELIYLNDGEHFILSSERDGFKHFYLHGVVDGQVRAKITYGQWEADEIVALDQSGKTPVVYYTSSEGDSDLADQNRHLYKVNVFGKGRTKLSTTVGINSANFSPDCKYYILYNHSQEQPYKIDLVDNKKGTVVKNLKENSELTLKHEEYGVNPKRYFTFKGRSNFELHGYLIPPTNFDSTKQYPVLVYQYSGPGVQVVRNSWGGRHFYWHQMLAQQGYIVAVVDTRGMSGRGEKFKKCTYKNLGKLEIQDLISTAKFLGNQPFVDKSRIGIWGWSYGGYMSSLALMKGQGLFKMAIAVAPVTSWRFYDTIYTERFLQKPNDNPEGYDSYSPLGNAAELKGEYLLIHGTGDDNVHVQHAIALQQELIKAGKQFQSFFYPDRAHGIGGKANRKHLYHMMTNFVQKNL